MKFESNHDIIQRLRLEDCTDDMLEVFDRLESASDMLLSLQNDMIESWASGERVRSDDISFAISNVEGLYGTSAKYGE